MKKRTLGFKLVSGGIIAVLIPQAEQMKSISLVLVNIIGGSANGAGHYNWADVQAKKGLSGILSKVSGNSKRSKM